MTVGFGALSHQVPTNTGWIRLMQARGGDIGGRQSRGQSKLHALTPGLKPCREFIAGVPGTGGAAHVRVGIADSGRSAVLIERLRVGGECPFVACIPSKAMLASARARQQARRLTDLGAAAQPVSLDPDPEAYAAAVRRRDKLSAYRDDSGKAASIQACGVTLLRGTARINLTSG